LTFKYLSNMFVCNGFYTVKDKEMLKILQFHCLFQDLVSYKKILCLTTRFKLQIFTFDVSSQDSLCTSIQLSPVSKLNTKYYKHSDECCTLTCLIKEHFFPTLHTFFWACSLNKIKKTRLKVLRSSS
jgi:hypothetical protein